MKELIFFIATAAGAIFSHIDPALLGVYGQVYHSKRETIQYYLQARGIFHLTFPRSSFISPGKRGINALFDVLQFVTQFTHVSKYPGAWNKKQKKLCRKICFDNKVSDL